MDVKTLKEYETTSFMVRMIAWGGFKIEQICSKKVPEKFREFLPAKVTRGNMHWWMFKQNHPNYSGLAKLVEHNDELVIVLVRLKSLDQVIPVKDLPNMLQTEDGSFIGGRELGKIIELKEAIAEKLSLQPHWSGAEIDLRMALRKQRVQEAEEAKSAKAQETLARNAARQKLREEILARTRVLSFTQDGSRRTGFPVTGEEEWRVLPDGTFCILVESFDKDTGVAGKPIENFVVAKQRGVVSRKLVISVSAEKPQASIAANRPRLPVKMETVSVKGQPRSVIVVENMDKVRELRDLGLNSGTLVMAPQVGKDGFFTIYALNGKEISTVSHCARASAVIGLEAK